MKGLLAEVWAGLRGPWGSEAFQGWQQTAAITAPPTPPQAWEGKGRKVVPGTQQELQEKLRHRGCGREGATYPRLPLPSAAGGYGSVGHADPISQPPQA